MIHFYSKNGAFIFQMKNEVIWFLLALVFFVVMKVGNLQEGEKFRAFYTELDL